MILAFYAALIVFTLFAAEPSSEECVLQGQHACWYSSKNAQKTSREVCHGVHIFCTDPHTLKEGARTTLVSALYNNGRDPVQKVSITAILSQEDKTSKFTLFAEQGKQEVLLWEKTAQDFKKDLTKVALSVSPQDGRESLRCVLYSKKTEYFLEISCITYPSVTVSVITDIATVKSLTFFQNEERDVVRSPSTSSPHLYRGKTFSFVRLPECLAFDSAKDQKFALRTFLQTLNVSGLVIAYAPQPIRYGEYGAISLFGHPDKDLGQVFYTREKNGGQCEIVYGNVKTCGPDVVVAMPCTLTPKIQRHIVFSLEDNLRENFTASLHFKECDAVIKLVFTKSSMSVRLFSTDKNLS